MTPSQSAMPAGRGADSIRRHQRVIAAIDDAARGGGPISVSAIARAAGVDRSFLYRHRDLLARAHAAQTAPATGPDAVNAVSYVALRADLANALERNQRLVGRARQLETRLSQLLSEQAWHASGLGAAPDVDELQRRLTRAEQANIELRTELDERTGELSAARASIREPTRALNQRHVTDR